MKTTDQPKLTPVQITYLRSRLDEAMPITHTDPLPTEILLSKEPVEDLGY